jgi:hypothetical protein
VTQARHRDRLEPVVILIDSARSFADNRPCRIAPTAEDAIALIRAYEFSVIDELWLDYDLGWQAATPLSAQPVVDELVSAANEGRPYPIGEIHIHAKNPAGASAMKIALQRAGYRVTRHYDLRTMRSRHRS